MKQWKIGCIEMESPLIIGAGVCKYPAAVKPYLHPDLLIGAVVTGSYTLRPNEGNKGPRLSAWVDAISCGFNSYGMPNPGIAVAYDDISALNAKRPIILSFAALSVEDCVSVLNRFGKSPSPVAAIEFNISCPNQGHLPMSFDVEAFARLVACIRDFSPDVSIWIKISPYLSSDDLVYFPSSIETDAVATVPSLFVKKVAMLLNQSKDVIDAVVCTNTIGNCRYRHADGTTVTSPFDGKAGLSGLLLKSIALRQARQMREDLPHTIDVIVSGGILSGDDAADALEVGQGFQVTSLPYFFGGPAAIPPLYMQSDRFQELLAA